MALQSTGDVFIHYIKSTGEVVESKLTGQSQTAAAAAIAAAFVAGTVTRIVYGAF